MNRQHLGWTLAAIFLAAAVFLGAQQPSEAQSMNKLRGKSAKGHGAFMSLLDQHGSKDMNLVVTVLIEGAPSQTTEILGRCVESTDEFLIIQMQNQRDYTFILWERVLWVTGKPSA